MKKCVAEIIDSNKNEKINAVLKYVSSFLTSKGNDFLYYRLFTSILVFRKILELYNQNNSEYRLLFYFYYGLKNGFPTEYFDDYFSILDKKMTEEETFVECLNVLKKSGKRHISFASKLTNLKYDDFPLIDKYIKTFFRIKNRYDLDYHSIIHIRDFYTNILIPRIEKELIKIKTMFNCLDISDIRMIDFLIWINKGRY